jgi:hypothetical protein
MASEMATLERQITIRNRSFSNYTNYTKSWPHHHTFGVDEGIWIPLDIRIGIDADLNNISFIQDNDWILQASIVALKY